MRLVLDEEVLPVGDEVLRIVVDVGAASRLPDLDDFVVALKPEQEGLALVAHITALRLPWHGSVKAEYVPGLGLAD